MKSLLVAWTSAMIAFQKEGATTMKTTAHLAVTANQDILETKMKSVCQNGIVSEVSGASIIFNFTSTM